MSRSFVPVTRISRSVAASLLLLAAAALLQEPALAAFSRGERGRHGMVVSVDEHATRIGLQILQNGGNAVDASIAVAFALSVSYPLAAPVGGGGFMLYRSEEGRHLALDFRERAPVKLRAELFLGDDGQPVAERSLLGGLAVGVPGSVAGLAAAHERWGSLPWAELLQPAIRLAEDGIPVSAFQAEMLAAGGDKLTRDPGTREILTRDGVALAEGQPLVQKELAATLALIAAEGAQAFYQGPIAEAIVAAVQAAGGVMELEDLLSYEPLSREPLESRYRGYRIVSFPPPSSGGIALMQMLAMLERYDLAESGPGSSLTVHLLAEVERSRSRGCCVPGIWPVARPRSSPGMRRRRARWLQESPETVRAATRPCTSRSRTTRDAPSR